jgi:hypothetical protein
LCVAPLAGSDLSSSTHKGRREPPPMSTFASAYGTFMTMLPASPPAAAGGGWGWEGGDGHGVLSSSSTGSTTGSTTGSSSSPSPPSPACHPSPLPPPAFPVHYRCLLLLNAAGTVVGVRLRWEAGLLRVTAVLSESVSHLCQVARGDIVTHVNGLSLHHHQLQQQQQGEGEEEEDQSRLSLLLRSPAATHPPSSSSSSPPTASPNGLVVELRLVRVRTLAPGVLEAWGEEDNGSAGAAASAAGAAERAATAAAAARGARGAYARLHAACGPMLLYEVHARDTLGDIARRFASTAHEIRHDNRDLFPPGERLPPAIQPGLLLRVRNREWGGKGNGKGMGMGKAGAVLLPFTPERRPAAVAAAGGAGAAAGEGWGGGGGGTASPHSSPMAVCPAPSCVVPPPTGGEAGGAAAVAAGTAAAAAAAVAAAGTRRCYHLVAAGETLEAIARRYGVGVLEVRQWNRWLFPKGEPRSAAPGDRLLLFCRGGASSLPTASPVPVPVAVAVEGEGRKGRRVGGGKGKSSAPIAIVAGGGVGSTGGGSGSGTGSGVPSPE